MQNIFVGIPEYLIGVKKVEKFSMVAKCRRETQLRALCHDQVMGKMGELSSLSSAAFKQNYT